MAISKRLRYEILRRDDFQCRYCRTTRAALTIDHVTPLALGGTDHPGNLVVSCDDCNAGKTSTLPGGTTVDGPGEDDVRWAGAIKRAAGRAHDQRDIVERYRATFKAEWDRWHYGEAEAKFPLPATWGTSIDQFHETNLPDWMWRDLVERTMTKNGQIDRFRHLSDLAWKRVGELRHAARAIAEGCGAPAGVEASDEIVVGAAVHIWRTFWMPEHQSEPPPEIEAQFRSDARDYFESHGADDLMKVARTCGEQDMDDLDEALEYVKFQEDESDEDSWDHDRFYATWVAEWLASAKGPFEPDEGVRAEFRTHVVSACAAGYDGITIAEAAFKAGRAHSSRVADYLESANEVLSRRAASAARKAALSAEATGLWLAAFAKTTGGDRPVKADIEKFTEHVAGWINWSCDEYILGAAQHAGHDGRNEIDYYLPKGDVKGRF